MAAPMSIDPPENTTTDHSQPTPDSQSTVVDSHARVIVEKPIKYGSVAYYRGKRAPAEKSHQWAIYVRDAENGDLTNFVDRVEFHLHPSFEEAVRVVREPPFQIEEIGWGEFEVKIIVHFVDASEPPATLVHMLHLHPPIPDKGGAVPRRPVVSERSDEIVFVNPSPEFYNALVTPVGDVGENPERVAAESEDLASIIRSHTAVTTELTAAGEAKAALAQAIAAYNAGNASVEADIAAIRAPIKIPPTPTAASRSNLTSPTK